jgi:hypothetical protein
MTEKIYEDKVITHTVIADDVLTGASVGTWQEDYPLREVDFVHIKHGKPITYLWANSIFLTTFGFGLNLLAKWFSQSDSSASRITKGEWIAFGCGLLLSVIFYLIGLMMPNERKRVMNDIEKFFKNAPKSRQAVKGAK